MKWGDKHRKRRKRKKTRGDLGNINYAVPFFTFPVLPNLLISLLYSYFILLEIYKKKIT